MNAIDEIGQSLGMPRHVEEDSDYALRILQTLHGLHTKCNKLDFIGDPEANYAFQRAVQGPYQALVLRSRDTWKFEVYKRESETKGRVVLSGQHKSLETAKMLCSLYIQDAI